MSPERFGGHARARLMPVAGVELGGTKCICTLATGPGNVRAREVVPTTSPEQTLGRIERVLGAWRDEAPLTALGIASFGPVDLNPASPTWGHITTTPKAGWQGIDVAPRLGRLLGLRAAFDTDVNGAALAEIAWGAGRGLADFAYVTVGTGVGVGLIVNGRPTRGFLHGELGHIRIARLTGDDWPGDCSYHRDCVEGLISGPALRARLGGADPSTVRDEHPAWESVAHALAQLCHTIVCAGAPRRIVIGGGVVASRPHLLPRVRALLVQSLAGYVNLPEGPYVTAPGLGDDAGPLGPIALALAG